MLSVLTGITLLIPLSAVYILALGTYLGLCETVLQISSSSSSSQPPEPNDDDDGHTQARHDVDVDADIDVVAPLEPNDDPEREIPSPSTIVIMPATPAGSSPRHRRNRQGRPPPQANRQPVLTPHQTTSILSAASSGSIAQLDALLTTAATLHSSRSGGSESLSKGFLLHLASDAFGNTALHVAAAHNKPEVLKYILFSPDVFPSPQQQGLKYHLLRARNSAGKSPAVVALDANHVGFGLQLGLWTGLAFQPDGVGSGSSGRSSGGSGGRNSGGSGEDSSGGGNGDDDVVREGEEEVVMAVAANAETTVRDYDERRPRRGPARE